METLIWFPVHGLTLSLRDFCKTLEREDISKSDGPVHRVTCEYEPDRHSELMAGHEE